MTTARPALSYALQGLSPRDETLFKSFMRLIDHRTLQKWSWCEKQADLQVMAEDGRQRGDPGFPDSVLLVGTERRNQPGYLSLPLHAEELERTLNALGQRLLGARPRTAATQQASQGAADPAFGLVQLVRWPPASFLTTPNRVKLATLMTGRPMTLPAMRERTGMDSGPCLVFIEELRQAGLLRVMPMPATMPSVAPSPLTGLLSRIRTRLGISSGQHA